MRNTLALTLSLVLAAALRAGPSGSGDPATLDAEQAAAKRAEEEKKKRDDDRIEPLVEIYLEAGSRALAQGFVEDASTLLHKALEVADKGHLERMSVARVLDSLGRFSEAASNPDKAEEYFTRAVALTEKIVGADSATTLKSREDLASFYARVKKYDQAETVLRESLKRVWKDTPGVKQPRTVLPILQQIADCHRFQKKYKDAENSYFNLLHQVKDLDGVESPLMVLALNNLADLFREEEKHTEAEKYLEMAVAVMDKALPPSDLTRPAILRALAGVKQVLGKTADAETLHLQVLAIANASGNDAQRAMALLEVGSFYHNKPDDTTAEKYYSEALRIIEKDFESRNLAMALVAVAECRLGLGKTDVAAADLNRAQVMIEHVDGKERETMAQVLRARGKCLLAQGKADDAQKVLNQAKALSTKLSGADDLTVGYTWELLGKVYMAQDNLAEADSCFKKATEIEEKFSNVAPQRLAENLEHYAKLLEKMDRKDDAAKQAKRAAELRTTPR